MLVLHNVMPNIVFTDNDKVLSSLLFLTTVPYMYNVAVVLRININDNAFEYSM